MKTNKKLRFLTMLLVAIVMIQTFLNPLLTTNVLAEESVDEVWLKVDGIEGGEILFNKKTGTITGSRGDITVANIPEQILGVTVKAIGDDAFKERFNWASDIQYPLKSVTLPETIEAIGANAFYSCNNLLSINLPYGLKSIGTSAFNGCWSLQEIEIPSTVEFLGDSAFRTCSSMKKVVFHNGKLEGIAGSTFRENKSLAEVYIPKSIKATGYFSFHDCDNLKDVYYEGTEEEWAEFGKIWSGIDAYATVHFEFDIPGEPKEDDKVEFQSHQYQYFDESLTWQEAKEKCEEMGGHLVTINSQEEQDFIQKLIRKSQKNYMWVGATRDDGLLKQITGRDSFKWVTGEKWKYENWNQDELNNAHDEVVKMLVYNGKWENTAKNAEDSLKEQFGYVCEWGTKDKLATYTEKPGERVDGFDPAKDGWPIVNNMYGITGDQNYKTSFWGQVQAMYGLKPVKNFKGFIHTRAQGWCFGLSITSILNYNKQIDLAVLNWNNEIREKLNTYGWHKICKTDSNEYFQITKDSEALKIIERAHLSQFSNEFSKAEVFKDDKSYKGVLEYLNSENPNPLLVTLSYGAGGHAVVIQTKNKPSICMEGELAGWYEIPLYDPNNPIANEQLKDPMKWYSTKGETESFLYLNPNSGDWVYRVYYDYRVNEKSNEYSFLYMHNIKFYDTQKLGDDYFNGTLSLFDPQEARIIVSDGDFKLSDQEGNICFEVDDGKIISCNEMVDFTPYFGDTSNDSLLGMIKYKDTNQFSYTAEGEVVSCADDCVYATKNLEGAEVSIDPKAHSIRITNLTSQDTEVAIQKCIKDDDAAIGVKKILETDSIDISAQKGEFILNSNSENAQVNLWVDNTESKEATEYESVNINRLDYVDVGNESLIYNQSKPCDYQIEINGNNGTVSCTVNGKESSIAKQGDRIQLFANAINGYVFNNWKVVPNIITIGEDGTFIMPDKNLSISGNFVLLHPEAPNIVGVAYLPQNGKILGVDDSMEWSDNKAFTNANSCVGTEVTGLSAGTYYVRVKAKAPQEAGEIATVVVPEYQADIVQGYAKVLGSGIVGESLSVDASEIRNNTGTLQYQWLRDGVEISGANENQYLVTLQDTGHRISCRISSTVESGAVTSFAILIDEDKKDIGNNKNTVKTSVSKVDSKATAHIHEYAWDYYTPDGNNVDTTAYYKCTICGDVKESYVMANSAYNNWNMDVAQKIATAKPNAEVKIDTTQWNTFHQMVLDALMERQDVTLNVKYTVVGGKENGKRKQFVIPAINAIDLNSVAKRNMLPERFKNKFCGFGNLADFEIQYVYGK